MSSDAEFPEGSPVHAADPPSKTYLYDFFLSFAGVNHELARRAKEQLSNFGYKVCYQDDDFRLGVSFMTAMGDAHVQSRKVIALFTPEYLASSPYTSKEFHAAIEDNKLVIFRFHGAEVPPYATTEIRQEFPDELISAKSLEILRRAAELQPTRSAARAKRIHIESLPHWQGTHESQLKQSLIGRARELEQLTAAFKSMDTTIVCVIAGGGFGKSALVKRWLIEQASGNYGQALAVYGYSFYKQGFEGGSGVLTRPFFEDFLTKMTDVSAAELQDMPESELVRKILAYLRNIPTLIILDGLEPHQYPRHDSRAGEIQSDELKKFVDALMDLSGEGLCIVTSRLMPPSLGGRALAIRLEALDHASSMEAFVAAGLSSTSPDLDTWATKSEGHPLLISLLAPAIESGHYDPEMFRADQVLTDHNTKDIPDTVQNVVATRLTQLGAEARAVMYCMSLYGHAITYGELRQEIMDRKQISLFTAPLYGNKRNIPGSSESLFRQGVDALTKAAIVTVTGHSQRAVEWMLEAHPLVQAGVRGDAESKHLELWKLANLTIYETKVKSVKQKQPKETKDLRKLYAAVPHGVQARKGQAAGWMYANRCLRGFRAYSTNRGMVADDVALISNYFNGNWATVREDIGLNTFARIQANVWAGILLTAVNRAHEGIPLMRTGLEEACAAKSFTTAARTARFLGVLLAMRGSLRDGEALLRESLHYLDSRSALLSQLLDWKLVDRNFQRMASNTMLGSILHEQGRFSDAEASFRNAELIQRKATYFTGLRNIWCYRIVDFLYDAERFEEARAALASASVKPNEPEGWGEGVFVDVILQLARLRGAVREADVLGNEPDPKVLYEGEVMLKSLELDQGFRMDWLQPVAKIAVAGKARLVGNHGRAGVLLGEAGDLIKRSGNVIFEVDLLMERGRLHLASEQSELARQAVREASAVATQIGYLCRSIELEKLRLLCEV